MNELLSQTGAWVLDVIERLGYPGLAALVFLENLFPPLPSEIILPLSGFVAGSGRLSLPGVVAASTVGSVAGALVLYAAGAALGEDRVRAAVRRFGRYARIHERDLDAAVGWFRRYGHAAVLLCRLVPIVRSLISIPAGLVAMPPARFTALTVVGTSAWNGVLAGLGYAAGASWPRIAAVVRSYERLVLLAAAVLAAGALLRRWRDSRGGAG